MRNDKRLIIVAGATASGKTVRAIELAKHYATDIVSCDSRQFYSELNIGVARPTPDELAAAQHHFVAFRSVCNPYNIFDFEQDALALLQRLFESHDVVVAVGGSGLYIDALINGVARLPDPLPGLRASLKQRLAEKGIESLREELQRLDPDYYAVVDRQNPIRLQRALEVCLTAGRPYSQLIAEQQNVARPFAIDVEMVGREPAELRERINRRVDAMMASGLYEEVCGVWHLQHLNTLHTVGYREFFEYGTPDEAARHTGEIAAQIKLNTWHYAKKQLTWFKKKLGEHRLKEE